MLNRPDINCVNVHPPVMLHNIESFFLQSPSLFTTVSGQVGDLSCTREWDCRAMVGVGPIYATNKGFFRAIWHAHARKARELCVCGRIWWRSLA